MNCPHCGQSIYPSPVDPTPVYVNLNAANGCNPIGTHLVINAANAINPNGQAAFINNPAVNAAAGCAGVYPTYVQF